MDVHNTCEFLSAYELNSLRSIVIKINLILRSYLNQRLNHSGMTVFIKQHLALQGLLKQLHMND